MGSNRFSFYYLFHQPKSHQVSNFLIHLLFSSILPKVDAAEASGEKEGPIKLAALQELCWGALGEMGEQDHSGMLWCDDKPILQTLGSGFMLT